MGKILFALVVTCVLSLCSWASPAFADSNGAQLFQSNCAACHALGTNRVMAAKNLKKEALQKYGMDSKEAIVYQVTNGKNAMPRFGNRLAPGEIDAIADYVLARAEAGWSK